MLLSGALLVDRPMAHDPRATTATAGPTVFGTESPHIAAQKIGVMAVAIRPINQIVRREPDRSSESRYLDDLHQRRADTSVGYV